MHYNIKVGLCFIHFWPSSYHLGSPLILRNGKEKHAPALYVEVFQLYNLVTASTLLQTLRYDEFGAFLLSLMITGSPMTIRDSPGVVSNSCL